jgi:hypothetical protein
MKAPGSILALPRVSDFPYMSDSKNNNKIIRKAVKKGIKGHIMR